MMQENKNKEIGKHIMSLTEAMRSFNQINRFSYKKMLDAQYGWP